MQKFNSILLDIDRTMTNSSGEISKETRRAVKDAIKRGYKIGLCSGRTFPFISNWIGEIFNPNDLHILAGGGQIMTTHGEEVWSCSLENEMVRHLCQLIEKFGGSYGFVSGDKYFAYGDHLQRLSQYKDKFNVIDSKRCDFFSTPLLYVTDLNDEIKSYVFSQKNLTVKHMIGNVSGREYFDITLEGVNKATAGKIWAEKNRVHSCDIIAVGDGENDLEIMEAVGYGVAMGNAVEELKEKADKIIGHTDENGLAVFLDSLPSIIKSKI